MSRLSAIVAAAATGIAAVAIAAGSIVLAKNDADSKQHPALYVIAMGLAAYAVQKTAEYIRRSREARPGVKPEYPPHSYPGRPPDRW